MRKRADQQPVAVAFDLDGTLLETERLARTCFEQACADVGVFVAPGVYADCVGSTPAQTRATILAACGEDFPYEAVSSRWAERYHAHVLQRPVAVKPGIAELLAQLRRRGIPLALVTSSMRTTVEAKLRHADLKHYFRLSVCGGEAHEGKPQPAPYLACAARLGVHPSDCWAIEDSANGVRAAVRAGFEVFQIPDEIAPSSSLRQLGHEILDCAEELIRRLS